MTDEYVIHHTLRLNFEEQQAPSALVREGHAGLHRDLLSRTRTEEEAITTTNY
jgi:hypothetical protein